MKKMRLLTGALIMFWTYSLQAVIWLPSLFSDNMVLQQNVEVPVWGWTTAPGEKIRVTGSWNKDTVTVIALEGSWMVKLPAPAAGGPYEVYIIGHEKKVIHNILIGEVWICSGQSNMERTPLQGLVNADEEIAMAGYPEIRFFTVPKHESAYPQDDTRGKWVVCTPETFKHFSSVGYFFGREIHRKMNVPVGLINSSWGGTPVEVWIPRERIVEDSVLKAAARKLRKKKWWPVTPGVNYNAMIHPLIPYTIAGVIWYQGESNRVNANACYRSFPLLITSWREEWGREFPFYFVQIAPFDYHGDNISAAIVRDAQLHTMKTVSNTGMVVTNDIGNLKDIHPLNKQDVGKRLALWALAKTYGMKDIVFGGPVYRNMELEGNKVIIRFDHVDGGLEMRGKELREFTIAGKDRIFMPAKTRIKGETVEVWSPEVKNPVAVRFAFTDTALPNLFNKAGLPASAFRTDNWKYKD